MLGMTQLKDREFSAGLAAIGPSVRFSDNGSSAGTLAGKGNGGEAGSWAYVLNAYLSWVGWSSLPKLDLMRTSGDANGTIAQTLTTDFRDAVRLAVGA